MNVSMFNPLFTDGYRAALEPANNFSSGELSTKRGKKPDDILNAFTATPRGFGECFDSSTHAAVIKMMMMTFGQNPRDMFEEVKVAGDGYDITMKDEFKVHISKEELKLTAKASRFAGNDSSAIADANVVLAAFAKRKQQTGEYGSFEQALRKSLEGETTQNCLRGMGMIGFAQFVPTTDMAASGALGVVETHNFGSAFVMDNTQHNYGHKQRVDRSYGYMLFNDTQAPEASPASLETGALKLSRAPVGVPPADIWSGFYQGVEGNCVTVSAIKAAMMRFGQRPQDIFKKVTVTAEGYEVVMRDSYKLTLTHDELRKAQAASNLKGTNPSLLADANFLYAASAKRAQWENNDGRARQSFEMAMETLNDGEYPGAALRRLGLSAYVRESTVKELINGAIGTLANSHHSVVVIGGMLDMYGQKCNLVQSQWQDYFLRALKLV